MQQEVDQVEGHFIVCGFRRVSRQVVENLQLRQMAVVSVEPDDAAYAEGEAEPPRIRGHGTDDRDPPWEAANTVSPLGPPCRGDYPGSAGCSVADGASSDPARSMTSAVRRLTRSVSGPGCARDAARSSQVRASE
jgi:hypothetical protein